MLLFKQHQPKKAKRCYKIESINPEKGIFSSMRETKDRKFVVCLCLANKTTKTTFPTEHSALREMRRYRLLYKPLKK